MLKGLGILLIVMHNYAHWLPKCVPENEYTFSVGRIEQLATCLVHGGPHVLLNILSHFGHYGVAIFLFVSGYGLVKKYEQSGTALPLGDVKAKGFVPEVKETGLFLLRHALKLWRLMLPALAVYVVIELVLGKWNRTPGSLLPLIGFYSNLLPHRDLILGPWWWFGLMMQFYILWRLLLFRRGKTVLWGTMAVCLAAMLLVGWTERGQLASTRTLTCYLHYNFPPSMLAFGLGIAHARYGLAWLQARWAPIVGLLIILVGSFNAGVWTFSSVGAVMLALSVVKREKEERPRARTVQLSVRQLLVFFGSISAWMFALHPVVRAYAVGMAYRGQDWLLYLSLVVYMAATVLAAWIMTSCIKSRKR